MAVNAYLYFKGNCREAVEFYADVFGVERKPIMTFGDVPPDPDFPMDDRTKKMVMHTYLDILGSKVMFSDTPGIVPFQVGNNVSLAAVSSDVEGLKAIFEKLKVGGEVVMELQETFWSKCYGSLVDKFGVNWQISHEA